MGPFSIVRQVGWTVLVGGVLCLLIGVLAHWREFTVIGIGGLVLLLLCLPFLAGRTSVAVDLTLEPERVVAGDSVAAGVVVLNTAATRLLPTTLEVAVSTAVHRYSVGALAPGGRHEETFTIRTERRGVIGVGPVLTRRGDPLGLFSRDVEWTPRREVLVRPSMIGLDQLGAGLLRDLEGVTTDAVSQSDLAFHALREYVPGDDLRHIHWRSSAKAMAASGESHLLVRQYLDTRRSHAVLVVDDSESAWPDPEDFETAMSIAASIAVRASLDEFDVSFVCGSHLATGGNGHRALDAVCRAEVGRVGLVQSAQRASAALGDASLLFLIGGPGTEFTSVLRGAAAFGPEVRRFGLLVAANEGSRVRETGGVEVLHVATLADLPSVLRWSVR